MRDLALGELTGVGDDHLVAGLHDDAVDHVGRGRDQRQAELPLQPFPHDLHVQQAEEPAPEAEAKCGAGLRLVDQCCVVDLQLVQGVAQFRVVVPVQRVQAGKHHRPWVRVPGERLFRGPCGAGDRVADAGLADVLDAGDEVADLARAQAVRRDRLRRDDADLQCVVGGPGGHHEALLAPGQPAVHHPHVGHDTAVGVVDRVEDQRAGRRARVTPRRRNLGDHGVEQVQHALAGLRRDPHHVAGVAADDVGQFLGVPGRLRGRQVDLVQHRDQVQVGVKGQIEVGQRLRLDALRGVHQQDGPLAGGQGAGDLVGEVDVPGRIDEVENVPAAVGAGPRQPDRLALDGDAALALDIHPVEVLCAHLAARDDPGELEHPVRERGLPVIDVRDDAEVPDDVHGRVPVGRRRPGRGRGPSTVRQGLSAHCCHQDFHQGRFGLRRPWLHVAATAWSRALVRRVPRRSLARAQPV